MMKSRALGSFGAILLGLVLIVILVPSSQFLTYKLNNSDLETAAPVGWAVGLLVSLVLLVATIRLVARMQIVSKSGMVIIYAMLTIAVPMMNMGLVRSLFWSLMAVQEHYVGYGVNTYRTAYQAEKPGWFPLVPTTEGLAWNKADRLLRLLQDAKKLKKREGAKRGVVLGVALEAKRLAKAGGKPDAGHEARLGKIRQSIALLGVDEAATILKQAEPTAGQTNDFRRALVDLGLLGNIEKQLEERRAASEAAAERLIAVLGKYDEHEACYLPVVMAGRPRKARTRFEQDRDRLTAEERADLERRLELLEAEFDSLRADASLLSLADFVKVRESRKAQYMAAFSKLDEETLARIRTAFVFRSSGRERKEMYKQDGRQGTPNQNALGFKQTLWVSAQAKQELLQTASATPLEKKKDRFRRVVHGLPWGLWRGPMIRWGALITCIFMFFMCLSEWLRRKWVDRENLAFPLVEIADNVIRHDYALEDAEDVREPGRRRRMFTVIFWVGVLLGALPMTIEALGNYAIMSSTKVVTYNMSEKILTTGFMRNIDGVFFVLSPIAVGILFLVSLEVSFSIWVIYIIYEFVWAFGRIGRDIRDSVYTGWGGGVRYPFEGEQLLGACLCFACIVLYKTWRSGRKGESDGKDRAAAETAVDPYIPAWLTRSGLVGTPLLIGVLLWNLGITNIPFMVFVGLVAAGLAIAAARVRAESGLPTQHVTYEFTKLPLVFGLAGVIGAKVYTVFISLAFLPVTLLFRLLPQQLENIELARRNRVRYGTIAIASLLAFVVALGMGMVTFLLNCYYAGSMAYGGGTLQGGKGISAVSCYPLWVSHFTGEAGLDALTQVHWIRIWFIIIGAAVVGLLMFLRKRVMRFPLHPIGYLLVLLSTFFSWIQPYFKSPAGFSDAGQETSWLWGSAFVAWVLKKVIIKYGGMNTYKKAKPLFIGLVVGAVFCVFVWNVIDLVVSIQGAYLPEGVEPTEFMKTFMDQPAYSPAAY